MMYKSYLLVEEESNKPATMYDVYARITMSLELGKNDIKYIAYILLTIATLCCKIVICI